MTVTQHHPTTCPSKQRNRNIYSKTAAFWGQDLWLTFMASSPQCGSSFDKLLSLVTEAADKMKVSSLNRRMGNIMLDLTYWVLHPKTASHYWQWPLASLSIQRTDNFLHDLTSRVSTRQLHLVILMMSACIFVATSSMQWNWTPRINTEKRVCIPRSLCVSRELTVLCQLKCNTLNFKINQWK